MYLLVKPEKCSSSLQLEAQAAADIGFNGNAWMLWFEDTLTYATEFLGVLILPVLAGIIYILNITLFKSFEIRSND